MSPAENSVSIRLTSAQRERLRKIHRLAEGGAPGERDNARRILDGMLRTWGISESELADTAVVDAHFRARGALERKLLEHVVWLVTGTTRTPMFRPSTRHRSRFWFELTEGDAVRVRVLYDTYLDAWNDTLELAFVAFVSRNAIHGEPCADSDANRLEGDQLDRARALYRAMERTPVGDSLPGGVAS
jgi:hypothetical protein